MAEDSEGEVLYSDNKIKIQVNFRDPESYYAIVRDLEDREQFILMQKRVMEEIARSTDINSIGQTLMIMGPSNPHFLREAGISPEYFGLACARAKMKEWKNLHLI